MLSWHVDGSRLWFPAPQIKYRLHTTSAASEVQLAWPCVLLFEGYCKAGF